MSALCPILEQLSDGGDAAGGAIAIDADDAKELVKALKSLKLPAKAKLAVAKGITFEKPARNAVTKVIAIA